MNEPTVLVVDDETAIRDMLRMALEIADLRCIEADNIHDAFTRGRRAPRHRAAGLDASGGSGLEPLRRLKRGDTTRDLPVIMLTAKTAETTSSGAWMWAPTTTSPNPSPRAS